MAVDRVDPAGERPGGDRGEVVDEALRRRLVSFAVMSRPTETRWSPFIDQSVSSTQSLWLPMKRTCSPFDAWIARTVLSGRPKATSLPSGDQLAP